METSRPKRSWLQWPLLLPIVALAAIWWKVKNDRFPYVGTWVKIDSVHDGIMKGTLAFDADGACSWELLWWSANDNPKNALIQRHNCSYRMDNDTAQLELLGREMQNSNGKWRYVHVDGLRSGPVMKSLTTNTVTPQQNGKVLIFTTKQLFYIDQKTGRRFRQNHSHYEFKMQRVK